MAGISIRNLREFDHLWKPLGRISKPSRNAPQYQVDARIMLLLKEILPEARQRNMLLPL